VNSGRLCIRAISPTEARIIANLDGGRGEDEGRTVTLLALASAKDKPGLRLYTVEPLSLSIDLHLAASTSHHRHHLVYRSDIIAKIPPLHPY
jgi:hypothetical protein